MKRGALINMHCDAVIMRFIVLGHCSRRAPFHMALGL